MVNRNKRLQKSIESLKNRIEIHFKKLEEDIKSGKEFMAKYHVKELDKNLIEDLEYKMKLLGKTDKSLIKKYRKKLKEVEDKIL